MLVHIDHLLGPEALAHARRLVTESAWADGRLTAGVQSARVKNNEQLAEDDPRLPSLRAIVLEAMHHNPTFVAAAIPRRIYPPVFNRYGGSTNAFGNHVDNAIRNLPDGSAAIRTDVSCTVFLSGPDEYDGGELIIEDTFGTQSVKLLAGDAVIYPSSSLHRVAPVTRGARLAAITWIESRIREDERRRVLFDLDLAIVGLQSSLPGGGAEHPTQAAALLKLTGVYHNLMRQWAQA